MFFRDFRERKKAMKQFLLLIAIVFLLAATGCSCVTVTEPIGEEPVQIQPKEWEGLWKLYMSSFDDDEEEVFLVIEVSDSEKGVLKVQGIGRESESVQVYLRESNGWMFDSYNADNANDVGMCWGRFERKGDRIFIWIPDYDRFSALVKDGLLPGHFYGVKSDGKFDDKYLILSGLKPEHMKLIASESKGVLFHWDEPLFMLRMSDHID
jgi:hypothetical protein